MTETVTMTIEIRVLVVKDSANQETNIERQTQKVPTENAALEPVAQATCLTENTEDKKQKKLKKLKFQVQF